MAVGFIPARGPWVYRDFTTLSTATFVKGSLVKLHASRVVSEYSGGEANLLGIALHDSVNSLPVGKVTVAIPAPLCTAVCDVPTGLAASALSLGQSYGIYKSGNTVSTITDQFTSSASKIVTIISPVNSALSTIEVSFLLAGGEYYSTVSAVIP